MFEREFLAPVSEIKILEVMSSLCLTPLVEYANPSKTVAICALKDSSGTTASEGAGKGRYCRTGALAESLEHFTLEHQQSTRSLTSCSLNEIRDQASILMDGVLSNLPKTDSFIDCVEMTEIKSGRIVIVPAVLLLPLTILVDSISSQPELSFLSRYSTNSGIAFGCSHNEAILHGLNEVLERHMLSKILMSLCGQHESIALTSPSTEIVEEIFVGQADLLSTAKNMKIIITETIHGVYFGMAIPKRPDGRYRICPVGSGCSIDPRVAIERAVTELLQTMELYDESEKQNDLCTLALLQNSPKLQPLRNLEILRNIEQTCKRLNPPMNMSVGDQVDLIIEKISTTGLRVLKRTLSSFSNGCAVTQVYVPGLERFNLIRAGIPVVPQQLLHANKSS